MLVVNQKLSTNDQTLRNNFIELSLGLAKMLQDVGLKTQAGTEGFPHFNQLTNLEKACAIERVQFYYDLCMEQLIEGQSLRDSKKFTWRALVKLGLTPQSDLLDRIEGGDVVEVYNEEQVQLFRNLEFFDICSYTIEELFCIKWWKLFRREENVSNEILGIVHDFYLKKYPNGLESPLPQHMVIECLSRDKFKIDFFMKYMGPLYKNKQVSGLICLEKAVLL